MQPEEIIKRIQQRPFQPFRVCLTDGIAYEVRHPEWIMVGKRTATLGLAKNLNHKLYDSTVDIDLLHIVRVEPIESSVEKPTANGPG